MILRLSYQPNLAKAETNQFGRRSPEPDPFAHTPMETATAVDPGRHYAALIDKTPTGDRGSSRSRTKHSGFRAFVG